ncbi:MAG: alpha-ketoacid dehydrogenase subunit beta [Deltaproteobacteria bacterium]|nr:alpha-ketoacid dehydrogenase subunit beta [Deltaproteobacteria bacterium]
MAANQSVTYVEAINQAIKEEMRRDEDIAVWGVDVIGDFEVTTTLGILEEFGEHRIMDTPITEEGIVGLAAGAAFAGLRPIVTLMHASFVPLALDALFLKLGCNYQEWGYAFQLPVVVMTPVSSGIGMGADLALSPEALVVHSPGLKVVMPSTPYDAKGLLKTCIRDDYPVIFMPHLGLYNDNKQEIPADEYTIPLGKADIKRKGADITIVTYSRMVLTALEASNRLSEEGIEAEVIDLRSLVPLDIDMIAASVKKTGRLIIVHEAYKRGGFAGEILFRLIEKAPELIKTLKHDIKRLTAPNISLPHTAYLEKQMIPQVEDIFRTVKEMF